VPEAAIWPPQVGAQPATATTLPRLGCVPSLVREEFGPTLPELVAARTGRPVRRVRALILGLVALLVVVGVGVRLAQREAAKGQSVVLKDGAFSFNLVYDDDRLDRVDPARGERLRLVSPPGAEVPLRFVVGALQLPAYDGDIAGFLPYFAGRVAARMEASDPAFVLRSESKARVNDNPGYQLTFQTRLDGRLVYGKRLLLFDDLDDDEATLNRPTVLADVVMLNGRSAAIPKADAVGGNGPLKTPYRSFRFGDERP